jgi:hypothetical protein
MRPDLSFPPLLAGRAAADPRADAVATARAGCNGGLLLHRIGPGLDAALVLAPEVPLSRALQTAPLAAVALRDAIGAIGPAEMPVHLEWDGHVRADGHRTGRVVPVGIATDGVPDWLVLHVQVAFDPAEPMIRIDPAALLESWSRHVVHRLAAWEEDGAAALHAELDGAAWERETRDPAWIGRDEGLGRLRRDGATTQLDPLIDLLEAP